MVIPAVNHPSLAAKAKLHMLRHFAEKYSSDRVEFRQKFIVGARQHADFDLTKALAEAKRAETYIFGDLPDDSEIQGEA